MIDPRELTIDLFLRLDKVNKLCLKHQMQWNLTGGDGESQIELFSAIPKHCFLSREYDLMENTLNSAIEFLEIL